jgi:hypothetical protein
MRHDDDFMTTAETRLRSIFGQLQDAVSARDLAALSSLFDDDIVLFGTAAAHMDRRETTPYLARIVAQEGTIRWTWDTVVPLVDEPGLLVFAGLTVHPRRGQDLDRLTTRGLPGGHRTGWRSCRAGPWPVR